MRWRDGNTSPREWGRIGVFKALPGSLIVLSCRGEGGGGNSERWEGGGSVNRQEAKQKEEAADCPLRGKKHRTSTEKSWGEYQKRVCGEKENTEAGKLCNFEKMQERWKVATSLENKYRLAIEWLISEKITQRG